MHLTGGTSNMLDTFILRTERAPTFASLRKNVVKHFKIEESFYSISKKPTLIQQAS